MAVLTAIDVGCRDVVNAVSSLKQATEWILGLLNTRMRHPRDAFIIAIQHNGAIHLAKVGCVIGVVISQDTRDNTSVAIKCHGPSQSQPSDGGLELECSARPRYEVHTDSVCVGGIKGFTAFQQCEGYGVGARSSVLVCHISDGDDTDLIQFIVGRLVVNTGFLVTDDTRLRFSSGRIRDSLWSSWASWAGRASRAGRAGRASRAGRTFWASLARGTLTGE